MTNILFFSQTIIVGISSTLRTKAHAHQITHEQSDTRNGGYLDESWGSHEDSWRE